MWLQQQWQGLCRYWCHNFNSSMGSNRKQLQWVQAGGAKVKMVYQFIGTLMKTTQGIYLEVWGLPSKNFQVRVELDIV